MLLSSSMRIIKYLPFLLLFVSCRNNHLYKLGFQSKWLQLKDSFAKQNLTEFKLDDILGKSYPNFHRIQNRLLDSTISDQWGRIYLYSWQQRDTSLIEFTTIIQEEDRGVRIVYFVFNKKDSLISETLVALGSMEADFDYSLYSHFKTKDTLLQTSAMTQWYDTKRREKLKKTKGDTSLLEIVFHKNGTTSEQTISEMNELHLNINL
jgi:hypothetical protein